MAIALVQTSTGNAGSSGAILFTAGNFVIVVGRHGGSSSPGTVNDASGLNTYTLVTSATGSGGDSLHMFYAENVQTDGISNLVTGTAFDSGIIVNEFSGGLTSGLADTSATGTAATGSVVTTGSYSTAQANELLIAAAMVNDVNSTWTPDTGWTNDGTALLKITSVEYNIVSSQQSSVTTSYTTSSSAGQLAMVLGTFKDVTAGGGGRGRQLLTLGAG